MSQHDKQPADTRQEVCDYCGLSLGGWLKRKTNKSAPTSISEPAYCCFGCRFAAAVTNSRGETGSLGWMLARLGVAIFFTLNVMVFSVALWAEELYELPSGNDALLAAALHGIYRYAALLFALPVLFILGKPLVDNAVEGLQKLRITLDTFLLLGVSGAVGISIASALRGAGPMYLDAACMVLVCVAAGRFLEASGRWNTNQALEQLTSNLPQTAHVLRSDGSWQDAEIEKVTRGQTIRISPGEQIPLDCVVESGQANVDERILTGESQPSFKHRGSDLFAASHNLDGVLIARVVADCNSGAAQRIVELVKAARCEKSTTERLADRLTHWLAPLVMGLALFTFFTHGTVDNWQQGFLAALAVLVIACPCALALATPLAISAAFGQAARTQLLFRNTSVLERLDKIKVVCFDKTGTLTTSEPHVQRVIASSPADEAKAISYFARLTEHIPHAYSKAIHTYASNRIVACEGHGPTRDTRSIPGRGVTGLIGPTRVSLGNRDCMQSQGLAFRQPLERDLLSHLGGSQTIVFIGWDSEVRAGITIVETIRSDAADAVKQLEALSIRVHMLTGDGRLRANTLANHLGIEAHAELMPEGKLDVIRGLREEFGPVAMVGDGVNDAPALAAADVGFALACGTAVSRDSADVCVLNDALVRVPHAVSLSRHTMRIVKQNFVWTIAYNTVALCVAASGYVSPVLATLAMVGSSVIVIANSTRLAYQSPSHSNSDASVNSKVSNDPLLVQARNTPSADKPQLSELPTSPERTRSYAN